MPTDQCRVCKSPFFSEPILQFQNMPAAAQGFPDAIRLQQDRGVDLDVCQCERCGLVQLRNDPVPYYREVIRAAAYSEEMRQFRIQQFKQFIEKYKLADKRILEIGCGRGEYLTLMAECGGDAWGIEYGQQAVKDCLAHGLQVQEAYLDASTEGLEGGPFDAFFTLNFLEHAPDPVSMLHGMKANLRKGGVGLIEVPNFNMVLEKNLFSEFIGDHLTYFTEDTFRYLLQVSGFEVINCQSVWYDYILSAEVRRRRPLDISHFQSVQSRLQTDLHGFINQQQRVAVWGAGHQALAVLSLAELMSRIVYVVDSAPFKQGKYTPATHIPIVSPDQLESDPVNAIIVMAASYSDEVAGIIKTRFKGSVKTAILRDYGLEVLTS